MKWSPRSQYLIGIHDLTQLPFFPLHPSVPLPSGNQHFAFCCLSWLLFWFVHLFCFPWDSTELFTQWWGPSTGISNMPKGCRCCWSHRIHWSKQPAIITALFSLILTPRRSTRVRAQFCPTFCEHMDYSPPGSPVHGISQARILEWAAISFSNIWKWKMKVKSLSCVWLLATPWTAAYQGPPSMGFSRQEDWSGVPLPSPKKELQAQ